MTGQDIKDGPHQGYVAYPNIAFRMMMQIRNKIVQAYQDVQNIRIWGIRD